MTVAVNDVLRSAVEGVQSTGNQAVVNVYQWQASFIADGDDDVVGNEIATQIDIMYNILESFLHDDYFALNLSILNVTQDLLLNDQPITVGGTAVGDPMPNQVTALVVGRTNIDRVQGRKYMGPFAVASANADGLIDAVTLVALASFADAYIAPFTGLSGNQYNAGVNHQTAPSTFVWEDFIGRRVVNGWRTQRSRTVKIAAG